jgi:hypothetical protein
MKQFDPIFFTPPSGDVKRPRTLYKGKKGGDGGAAARQAAEDARVSSAINHINNVFGVTSAQPERENLYSKISTDATNTALNDLNKEKSITERDLNFMLARQGLSGGSRDIDVNKDVLDTYQQGVLKASNIGISTGNDARSADDRTRVNLINSIRSGLDQGSATQQAYEGMRNNASLAQDNANAVNLSGFFDAIKNQQQQAAYIQGINSNAPLPIQQQKVNSPASSSATSNYDGTTRTFK